MIAAIVCMSCPLAIAQKSPSQKPSPKPLTPQQKLDAARREQDAAGVAVIALRRARMEARGRLIQAERDWADAVEAMRNSGDDATLREAAAGVIEARTHLNEQREAAFKPLRKDQEFQEQSRELALAEIRLDELKAARLSAELQAKTLDPAVPREITKLSMRVLELRRMVTDAEAQAIENHRGYAEAEERLTQSFAQAEAAARALRELRRDNPRLQAAVGSLKAAGGDITRLSGELAAATQRYSRAAAAVAAAQGEVARAAKRK